MKPNLYETFLQTLGMHPIIANGNHIIRYNHVGFKIIDYGVVMHESVFEENFVMLAATIMCVQKRL